MNLSVFILCVFEVKPTFKAGLQPYYESLERIASYLDVGVSDLFVREGIIGFIRHNGEVHEINSISDIEELLKKVRG